MIKRKEQCTSNGFLRFLQVRGMANLLLTFLMQDWNTAPNEIPYRKLISVCRKMNCLLNRVQYHSLFHPHIKSISHMHNLFSLVPQLRGATFPKPNWVIPFTNLKVLHFEDGIASDSDVRVWNCPLLEKLSCGCMTISSDVLQAMAECFPKLRTLRVNSIMDSNLIISRFPCLTKLSIAYVRPCGTMYISDMPSLEVLNLQGSAFDRLQFNGDVANLSGICSSDSEHSISQLIFLSPVPKLDSLDLGDSDFEIFDPHNHVLWSNIVYFTANIKFTQEKNPCSKLCNIKKLRIPYPDNEKEVAWFQFSKLKELYLNELTSNYQVAHVMNTANFHLTLQILDLTWEHDVKIDLSVLEHLVCLVRLCLTGILQTNISKVFDLPKLCSVCISDGMKLSKVEKYLYADWEQKKKIFTTNLFEL